MPKVKPGAGSSSKKAEYKRKAVQAPAGAAELPEGFKRVRTVTLPSFSLKEIGVGRGLKIMDAIRVSKVEGKPDKDGNKPKPADICTAADVQTGQMYIFIVPAVVKSNLERDYPKESYVDKGFYMVNMGKRTPNQRYNDYAIDEIAV